MKRLRYDEAGFTLIELLVSTVIGGFVIAAFYLFLTRVIQKYNTDEAQEWARATHKEIIRLIRRDLKFYSSHVIPSGGRELQITRKQFYELNQAEATYVASFSSYCSPITPIAHPGVRQAMIHAYSGLNSALFASTPNRCIQSMGCPLGQFPSTRITVNPKGPRVPVYPIVLFPNIQSKYQSVSAGTGLCFAGIGSKIRIVAESVYFIDKITGKLGMTYEEVLVSPGSGTPLELLPLKN